MIRKYKEWYKGLTPLKKLLASFILYWFYFAIAWFIAEQFFFDEKGSWKLIVFQATWLTFIITVPPKWKEIKPIFLRKRGQKAMN